ncbi:MAG: YitT family protein [Bacteroidetes bacterium]|nr:YitT family protein [Bacteroidota bacterium]
MQNIKFSKETLRDYIFIAIGAAIMSLSIAMLVDVFVVPGGAAGLSMAIYYLTDGFFSIGVLKWMINVPLFIWGYKVLGNTFGLRTFYGFSLCSFFIDFFRGEIPGFHFIKVQESAFIKDMVQNDFLFLIIFAAILMGVGLGIIFKYKGTTGGSDIGAAIMQKKLGIMPGRSIMIIDFFVIALAAVIISVKGMPLEKPILSLVLYALLLLFASSWILDLILDGFDYARMVLIISDKSDEVAEAIMHKLTRGATALKSRGIYRNIDREIIMTVVTIKEVPKINTLIKEIDPNAFIVINPIYEINGTGFKRRSI